MEQHSVPRQITTFEFKLVGFMTLKQFIYLLIAFPIAYIVMSLFPIPYLNIFLALLVAFFGIALAFIPINDRPMDVYIKNFVKRVFSPTQYYYQKTPNQQFVTQAYFDKKKDEESKQKLSEYLLQKNKTSNNIKQTENVKKESEVIQNNKQVNNLNKNNNLVEDEANIKINVPSKSNLQTTIKKPFFTGIIKNNKEMLLPGMLVYIKDQNNNILGLLKSDSTGLFRSFNKLPSGIYDIEIKDPNQNHVFDKIKIELKEENLKPFEFFSKELI